MVVRLGLPHYFIYRFIYGGSCYTMKRCVCIVSDSRPRSPIRRNFTAGSSRVHCTTCCVHRVLPVQARPSTFHGYGNSLRRIDSEQVEGLALEGGGLGGDGDGGLRLGGQGEAVQSDGGEIPQQGREAVHGKTLRCGLGVGLVLGAIGDLHRFDGRVAPCRAEQDGGLVGSVGDDFDVEGHGLNVMGTL